jgi:hypothetical protein
MKCTFNAKGAGIERNKANQEEETRAFETNEEFGAMCDDFVMIQV